MTGTPLSVRRNEPPAREIVLGAEALTIEDVLAVAQDGVAVRLSAEPEFERSIRRGPEFLDRLLDEDGVIYGVTTGYGDGPGSPSADR
jgi:histidine ammonia-lyase